MTGVDFSQVEREWVSQRLFPGFSWQSFDEFSPLNPLAVPLTEARIALVTTSGVHLKSDKPFDKKAKGGDASFRAFGSESAFNELALTHVGYDTKRALADINVVLPLDHLRHAAAQGTIGELTPTIYSFMGYIPDTTDFIGTTAPEVARLLAAEQPDLVLLVPT